MLWPSGLALRLSLLHPVAGMDGGSLPRVPALLERSCRTCWVRPWRAGELSFYPSPGRGCCPAASSGRTARRGPGGRAGELFRGAPPGEWVWLFCGEPLPCSLPVSKSGHGVTRMGRWRWRPPATMARRRGCMAICIGRTFCRSTTARSSGVIHFGDITAGETAGEVVGGGWDAAPARLPCWLLVGLPGGGRRWAAGRARCAEGAGQQGWALIFAIVLLGPSLLEADPATPRTSAACTLRSGAAGTQRGPSWREPAGGRSCVRPRRP